MDAITFEVHQDELPVAWTSIVDEGLGAYNLQSAPLHLVRALGCVAHGSDARVLGGAVGRTWGACCELQQLWVDGAHRHRGLGTALMQRFHDAAEARGCRLFYLDTFSFQAADFYARLGYEKALTIEGFGTGLSKHTMLRRCAS